MMREIRWHGRGGQGAKSVSQLLAGAMLRGGFQVQAFPEYGPERSGAPLQAYTRSSTRPIRLHCGVTEPDSVVVLDDSLLGEIDVVSGLKEGGLLLVNTTRAAAEISELTGYAGPIVTLDAGAIAAQAGARHSNVVMVGALAALEDQPGIEDLTYALDDTFEGKISQEALEANHRALEAGFRQAEGVSRFESPSASGGAAGSPVMLRTYRELPAGGVLPLAQAEHPRTGNWRTEVKPRVEVDRCVNCLLCWVNCPDSAIVLHGTEFFGFDHDYCKGCELCAEVCPTGAIEMVNELESVPAYGRVEGVRS